MVEVVDLILETEEVGDMILETGVVGDLILETGVVVRRSIPIFAALSYS